MHKQSEITPGTLYVVATPIGNLEDITLRALKLLKEVDRIAAEDTRHTKKLLNHFGIHTPLISYYREKENERGTQLIHLLEQGESIALVTDAGTPAISDPGAILVQMAHEAGFRVCPIPGASALTAALSVSGYTDGSFLFVGFAPAKSSQRRKLFASLVHTESALVFYESPRRIQPFLKDAAELFGDRVVFWAREITKAHEELNRSTLQELLSHCRKRSLKGESVIIIEPARVIKAEGENIEELLTWYRDNSGLSLKDTCRKLAEDLGLSRSQIYQQALVVWKEHNANK